MAVNCNFIPNLFTHVCQENGLAKVIGMTSGGGACVVYYSATPDGKCFRISGNMREGKADNYVSHNYNDNFFVLF